MTQPETQPAPDASHSSARHHTNVAQDGSNVGVQIGLMLGDTHTYQTSQDTPQELYRVGRNYLSGNVPRQAEPLIRDAFMRGHRTAEVAYHWALSILSGRTLDQLEDDDTRNLETTFEFVDGHGDSPWCKALRVVYQLVQCVVEQDSQSDSRQRRAKFDSAMTGFEALPPERSEEVRRHLEMILNGEIQDQLDAVHAEEVETQRMSGGRTKRAWKFFEPEPSPPRMRLPRKFKVAFGHWIGLSIGAVVFGSGLFLLLPLILRGSELMAVAALSLCGIGGFLAVKYGWERSRLACRLKAMRADRAEIPQDFCLPDEPLHEFALQVKKLIDLEFSDVRPHDDAARKRWAKAVKGIKNSLCRELVDVYGQDADLRPIRWLVRWYARRTRDAAKQNTLPDHRLEPQIPASNAFFMVLGLLLAGLGIVSAVAAAVELDWQRSILATLLLLTGAGPLLPSSRAVYLEWRRYRHDLNEMTFRHAQQKHAYNKMSALLRDRPSDGEMARWLDYDKALVKLFAMEQYQLSNRQVIAHAVLSEGIPFRRHARVPFGPPRYSAYHVLVFLLTDGGVRQVTVEVSCTTGLISDERRTTFHYEALASAQVSEVGVRLDRRLRPSGHSAMTRRRPRDHEEGEWRRGAPTGALVLSRTFRLSLVNDQTITVRVENFDEGLIDRIKEDSRSLLELALDVAGITGALGILEAVAAEGKEWISRERKRRAHRALKFKQQVVEEEVGPERLPVPRRLRRERGGRQRSRGAMAPTQRTPRIDIDQMKPM